MALKSALVSVVALACCAPLPLPFDLPVALFRSQEFVARWLHTQWDNGRSAGSGNFCSLNNNLCKIEIS